MGKQITKIIKYAGHEILFITNDVELCNNLVNEYEYYFQFEDVFVDKYNLCKIKVLKDKVLYESFYKNIKEKRKKENECFCEIRRENIIIIDKESLTINVIYDEYNNSRLQHIEELVLAVFGKNLEDEGYYFIHAACIAKNDEGIIIIGNKHTGKTSLLLEFLKNSFDFVTNAQLGIKNKNGILHGISIPSRVGIRIQSLYNGIFNDEYINKVKKSKEYMEKFIGIKENELKNKYGERKFNLDLTELREYFNINLVSTVKIKGIIEPHFLMVNSEMGIKKMSLEEIGESIRSNRRDGVYCSVDYVKHLYDNYKPNEKYSDILKSEIQFLKVFQNSSNEKELINLANDILLN